ncbi:MAG: endonuclease/exonuclease/phosphatase family protein [Patescibacteria group bacterium]
MKLITLNTWGGKVLEPLLSFIKEKENSIDIFCFQEVFKGGTATEANPMQIKNINPRLYEEIEKLLSNHVGYFSSLYNGEYGLATFVRKDIKVKEDGAIMVHENSNFPVDEDPDADHNRLLQWFRIEKNSLEYLVANLHGHWTLLKHDTPERLAQSQRILGFLKGFNLPKIICGDFNVRPETESIRLLEESGLRNLVSESKIATTRTSLYKFGHIEPYADYIFISPEIELKNFNVLPDEVSDHAPLYLEFE